MLTTVEACSFCPDWGEELLGWVLQLATSVVSGDWWKKNFVFAWPCTPFDFMCLSMFPLWVQFMQSTYLSKVSATDPYKSLALAYTQICCKHWVHVLHISSVFWIALGQTPPLYTHSPLPPPPHPLPPKTKIVPIFSISNFYPS